MRILLLSNLYPPYLQGGAEIVARDVALGLEGRGHEVIVLTSSYGSPTTQQDRHTWRTLHYSPPAHFDRHSPAWRQLDQLVSYYRNYHRPANAKELRRVINATKPDVLLVCEIQNIGVNSLLTVLSEVQIPVVFYLQSYWLLYAHSPETEQSRLRARRLKKLLIGSIPPLTYKSLVAVSDALKQEYVKAGYNAEHIEVIHNGIDPHLLHLPEATKVDSNSTTKDVELIYAGRLLIEKGVLVLLKALDLLVNEQGRQNIHLSIFGEGDKPYISELQAFLRAKRLTHIVTFYGKVPQHELIEHYDRSYLMLMPSLWKEPFALVTAEAMARGLPVIASDVGGTSERITHGVNGLLVKPGDERALAAAIEQMLENPDERGRFSRAAHTTVRERFTVEECTRRMEQHLLRAVQGDQGSIESIVLSDTLSINE
jgi:glycogen(starch) synthase